MRKKNYIVQNGKDHKMNRVKNSRKARKASIDSCVICPVCTVTVRGNENIEEHYHKEVRNLKEPFVDIDDRVNKYKTRLRSRHKHLENEEDQNEEEETQATYEERTKNLKDIKKRKYTRYADMYLMSMKRRKMQTEQNNQHTNYQREGYPSLTSNATTRRINRITRSTTQRQDNANINLNTTTTSTEDNSYELIPCAVCTDYIEAGSPTGHTHISRCFARHNYHYSLFSSSEAEESEEETVEEFSWAGQTWIRSAPLSESESANQEGRLTRLVMEDGDDELDIDGDADLQFGEQQFSERDIIPCASAEDSSRRPEDNRDGNSTVSSSTSTGLMGENQATETDQIVHTNTQIIGSPPKNIDTYTNIKDTEKYVEYLQKRITTLENRLERETMKCPICMGPYLDPVISVNCWHACCATCWLRVLGAKKLCPKCSEIVTAAQLRKVYL